MCPILQTGITNVPISVAATLKDARYPEVPSFPPVTRRKQFGMKDENLEAKVRRAKPTRLTRNVDPKQRPNVEPIERQARRRGKHSVGVHRSKGWGFFAVAKRPSPHRRLQLSLRLVWSALNAHHRQRGHPDIQRPSQANHRSPKQQLQWSHRQRVQS